MEKTINNKTINNLLENWSNNKSKESYINVVDEITDGKCFFYVPTNKDFSLHEIYSFKSDQKFSFQFSSVFDNHGLLSIAVFTEETLLKQWAKYDCGYIKFLSNDFLKMCDSKNIFRVLINSSFENSFILEKTAKSSTTKVQKKVESLRFWTPKITIDQEYLNNIIISTSNISSISETYFFGVTKFNTDKSESHIYTIGLKLDTYNESSKKASIIAVNNAINKAKSGLDFEVLFLEDEKLYNAAKKIKNGLIYKRVE